MDEKGWISSNPESIRHPEKVPRLQYLAWNNDSDAVMEYLNSLSSEEKHKVLLATDNQGKTALIVAAVGRNRELTKLILSSIPSKDILKVMEVQDNNKDTALHYAAAIGGVETVQMMLDSVRFSSLLPFLLKQNGDGETPLEVVESSKMWTTVELLRRQQEQLMSEETNIGDFRLEARASQLPREELANHSKEQTTRNQALEEEVACPSALLEKQATLLEAKAEPLDTPENQIKVQEAQNMIPGEEANKQLEKNEKRFSEQERQINDLTKRLDAQERKFHAREKQINAHEIRLYVQETWANLLAYSLTKLHNGLEAMKTWTGYRQDQPSLGRQLTALKQKLAVLEGWVGYEPNILSLTSQLEDCRKLVEKLMERLSVLEKTRRRLKVKFKG